MTAPSDSRHRKLETLTFLAVVLVTTALFLWVIRPFFSPLFWAAVFALLFQGMYTRLLRLFRGRRAPAALLATLATVLFVVLPFAAVLAALARQGLLLYQGIASGEISVQAPIDMIERWLPAVAGLLERYGVNVDQLRVSVQEMAAGVTQSIAGWALAAGQNVLLLTLLFGLMLYLLFFFFRDGDRIVDGVMRVLPLGEDRKQRLLRKFAEVARATVKGTLIIAVVQGGLGALLFAIVGIRTAVFWGVVMAVLSLLPAVGAGLIWLPAAVILFAGGNVWQGLLVMLGGVFVIGVVDNLLRPIVVGRETKTPDYLILLSTLGGIAAFGLAGFVAGPMIAALFLVLWDMFGEEYAGKTLLAEPPGKSL
jgi:predicted PurR-regulated permease PerM